MPSSRGSPRHRDQTCVSYISSLAGVFFTAGATWGAQPFSRPHLSVSSFPSRGPLPRGPLRSSMNRRPRLSSPTSPANGVSLLLPSGHCWTFLGPGPRPLWSAHRPPRHLSCRCPRPRPEPPQTPFAHSRACTSLCQGAEARDGAGAGWADCWELGRLGWAMDCARCGFAVGSPEPDREHAGCGSVICGLGSCPRPEARGSSGGLRAVVTCPLIPAYSHPTVLRLEV